MQIDIEEAFKWCSDDAKSSRQDYHIKLGEMINILLALPHDMPVVYDDADLAFSDGEEITAGNFLKVCKQSLDQTFDGCKGGEFIMGEDTPLWRAEYGTSNNATAITHHIVNDKLLLLTKAVL